MFMTRAMCNRLALHLQSAEFPRSVTGNFECNWTISECGNAGTQIPENLTQQSSLITALFTVYSQ